MMEIDDSIFSETFFRPGAYGEHALRTLLQSVDDLANPQLSPQDHDWARNYCLGVATGIQNIGDSEASNHLVRESNRAMDYADRIGSWESLGEIPPNSLITHRIIPAPITEEQIRGSMARQDWIDHRVSAELFKD